MNLWNLDTDGTLTLDLHPGQARAWQSRRRIIAVLAGTLRRREPLLHHRREMCLPHGHSPIGFAVAGDAERDQVYWVIVGFSVVDMMHMQRPGGFLRSVAFLARKVIALANPITQIRAKRFGVADIVAFASAPRIEWDTRIAVHSFIAAHYQTVRLADRRLAPGTGDGDGVVVSVVFALLSTMLLRPLPGTGLVTEVMAHFLVVIWLAAKRRAALLTNNRVGGLLEFRPMTG